MTSHPAKQQSARDVAAAAGLALLVVAARAPFLPVSLADHDAANFARSLAEFDLAAHSPHPPGYPVYVALARAFAWMGAGSPAALAWPNVAGAALATAAIYWSARIQVSRAVAAMVALAYASLPGLWLGDVAARPDALGAHLLAAAVALLALPSSARWVAVLLGLALGVRLSSWPAVAVLALALPRRAWAWTALAVAAWLLPLAVLAGGPVALWRVMADFGSGHFASWGNTAVTDPGLRGLAGRAGQWLGHAWALGGWGLAIWLALRWPAARIGGWSARNLAAPAAALGYWAWIVAAQNPDHPRHALPVVAMLAAWPVANWQIWTAASWPTRPVEAIAADARAPLWPLAAAVAASVLVAVPVLPANRQPSPAAQLAAWLSSQPQEGLEYFGGSEVGVLRALAPTVRSRTVAAAADALPILRDRGAGLQRAYVGVRGAMGVRGAKGLPSFCRPVAQFLPRAGIDGEVALTVCALPLRPAQMAVVP